MRAKKPKHTWIKEVPLEQVEVRLGDNSVMRICKKLFGEHEVIDMRLWVQGRPGNWYPKQGQGICMKVEGWKYCKEFIIEKLLPMLEDNVPITNS